jgi:hypothetical protein
MSSDSRNHFEVKSGSEKSFGIVFAAVFLLIGLYPLMEDESVRLWALGMALVFFALAYLTPKTLALPNKLWFKLGLFLGAVVAPVVMTLVFFTTIVPIGLIMRLIGKDLLRLKLYKNAESYWIERNQPVGSMKDQF